MFVPMETTFFVVAKFHHLATKQILCEGLLGIRVRKFEIFTRNQ